LGGQCHRISKAFWTPLLCGGVAINKRVVSPAEIIFM
jgi:hypothetical protein